MKGPSKGKVGRLSKFTSKTVERLESNISAGLGIKRACRRSGISPKTYLKWVKRAMEDNAEPELLEFLDVITRANARAKTHHSDLLRITPCRLCKINPRRIGKTRVYAYCYPCHLKTNKEAAKRRRRRSAKTLGSFKRTPKATISPSIGDLRWAAGFLEGKGIFVHGKKRTRSVGFYQGTRVLAQQNEEEMLLTLQNMFGGRVGVVGRSNRRGKEKILSHYWATYGARARGILMTLYPFISKKRRSEIRKAVS